MIVMNNNIKIGLTGRFGAGCTVTSVYYEKEFGCKRHSLSSELKKVARKEHKEFKNFSKEKQRRILQDLGDKLRQKEPTYLADIIIKQIKQKKVKSVVIDSIRNPAEVEAFKDAFSNNFYLLAIDSEVETRWKRLEHDYNGDRKAFYIADERDAGNKQPEYGQQVKSCIEVSDILINNNDSFYKNVKLKRIDAAVMDRYGQKLADYTHLMRNPGIRTPNFDELNMHYACSVALRSNCLKRQVGAVIVREKTDYQAKKESYVISTGCNNVPVGENACASEFRFEDVKCNRDRIKKDYLLKIKHCMSCGKKLKNGYECNNCNLNNAKLPGKLLDICRAVHAEEAAILQAARLGGTGLEDAKLYSSTFPCMLCCKKIINAGIKNLVYLESYPMEESLATEMFRTCKVGISKFEGVNSIAFARLFRREN